MSNHCESLPIILTTFIVILLVFNSTSAGISSKILFQNSVSEVTQNNLMTSYVFASPDEESDENNDGAGEDSQGLPDEEPDENNDGAGEDIPGSLEGTEGITAVNPALTALSAPTENQECPVWITTRMSYSAVLWWW